MLVDVNIGKDGIVQLLSTSRFVEKLISHSMNRPQ